MYERLERVIKKSKKLSEVKKERLLDLIKTKRRIDNECVKELYNEAVAMYDSFIDQFYFYKTRSYIRHGDTAPGTMHGINLYRGQDFNLTLNAHNAFFTLDFSSSDMESSHYRKTPASTVLKNVLSGYRFKRKFKNGTIEDEWCGSYYSPKLKFKVANVTMAEAFKAFEDNYADMFNRLRQEKWRRYD